MSTFFRKAAGLIFDIEESGTAKKPAASPQNTTTVNTASVPASLPPLSDDKAVEKFRSYFKNLYEKSNTPGPDFFEFNAMTEAMGSVLTDEVKYPSVFAGL